MRMHRAALLFGPLGFLILSSVGCESAGHCRCNNPTPRYLPPATVIPAPPGSPPLVIPENSAPIVPPSATSPTPPAAMPPGKLPISLRNVPTIPSPPSGNVGPMLSPPSGSAGSTGKALSSTNTTKPEIKLGEPEFPLLLPPVAVENDVPRAEILGIYGRDKDGNPIPARDENGRPIPLPPGVAPGTVPGVIPLPPGSDLPPLPEKKPEPKRNVPFRPDLTA